jgi:hypothetical protein
MCAKEKAEAVKNWWGKSPFLQSQFATIVTIIFLSGVAYNTLENLQGRIKSVEDNNREEFKTVKESVKGVALEQKSELHMLHQIDKKVDVHDSRLYHLEKELDRSRNTTKR